MFWRKTDEVSSLEGLKNALGPNRFALLQDWSSASPPNLPASVEHLRLQIDPELAHRDIDDYCNGRNRRMEIWRNVLFLLPLTLTWAALGSAASTYLEVAQSDTGAGGRSFLELWQADFNGAGPWHSFSFARVAWMDVLLLAAIGGLAIWHHFGVKGSREKSQGIRLEFDTTMATIAARVDSEREKRETDALRKSHEAILGRVASDLVLVATSLSTEGDRLAKQAKDRDSEISKIAGLTKTIEATAFQFSSAVTRLGKTAASLDDTIRLLDDTRASIDALASLRTEVPAALTAFSHAMSTDTTAWTAAIRADWTSALADWRAALTDANRDQAEVFHRIAEAQERAIQVATSAMATALDRAVSGLDGTVVSTTSSLRTEFETMLRALRSDLDAFSTRTGTATASLETVVKGMTSTLNTFADGIGPKVADAIDGIAPAMADALTNIGPAVEDAMHTPLGELAGTLARLDGALADLIHARSSESEILLEAIIALSERVDADRASSSTPVLSVLDAIDPRDEIGLLRGTLS